MLQNLWKRMEAQTKNKQEMFNKETDKRKQDPLICCLI